MKRWIASLIPLVISAEMLAAADDVLPSLPRDVVMSQGTGQGKHIILMVRVGHGDELPFILDTGASLTAFDDSLAPQLGPRIQTMTIWRWGERKDSGVYATPHFYLGGTRLLAGPTVTTCDFKDITTTVGRPVMGLIGMDVLEHYCVQLDFAAGKVRFLDAGHADKSKWGRPIPLTNVGDGCLAIRENLAGVEGAGSLIDTGDNSDGWLVPETYRQWTNQVRVLAAGEVHSPHGVLNGDKYRHIDLRMLDVNAAPTRDLHMQFNGVGLRALSRYVVTFDFPNRTMYLKRPSAWSVIF